jgi:hypothetical protein
MADYILSFQDTCRSASKMFTISGDVSIRNYYTFYIFLFQYQTIKENILRIYYSKKKGEHTHDNGTKI